MMSINKGRISSRVDFRYNEQYPLSLAFRRDPDVIRRDGRADWANAVEKFRRLTIPRSTPLAEYGFDEADHRCGNTVILRKIDVLFLNWAWAQILSEYDWHETASARIAA